MPAGRCQDLPWHRATSRPPNCPAAPPPAALPPTQAEARVMRMITHVRASALMRLSPLAPISLPLSQLSARRAPPVNLRVPSLVEDLEQEGRAERM